MRTRLWNPSPKREPQLGIPRQNGPDPPVHDVDNIPNTGFSLKENALE
jgi:hypothetical protein